jgi:hypothetical protein
VPSPAASPARGERLKMRETLNIVTPQFPDRRGHVAALTAGYGVVVTGEGHHVPAAAFEHAVKQTPASGGVSIRSGDHPAALFYLFILSI